MKHLPTGSSTIPFAALLALITTTSEMLLASGEVIRHRTERMLKTGPTSADDQREFHLMSSEKIEAAVDSSNSMVSLWMTKWNEVVGQMLSAQQSVATALASLASSRTPIELAERQATLSKTVTDFSMTPERFADDAIELAGYGLAPFHSAALANAKRLGSVV